MPSNSLNASDKENEEDELIILDMFYDYFIANSAKHKLEAHGIECTLEENNLNNVNSHGNIELKVSSEDVQSAFEILSE